MWEKKAKNRDIAIKKGQEEHKTGTATMEISVKLPLKAKLHTEIICYTIQLYHS